MTIRMSQRIPAQSIMEALLIAQKDAPPRSGAKKFFGISPLDDDGQPWYDGIIGERHVGAILGNLPSGWLALHGVPIGTRGSDIDHILVSRAGVFNINTKRHNEKSVWVAPNVFMVSGHKQKHIRNSVFESDRLAKMFAAMDVPTVEPKPLIVVVHAKTLTIKEKPERVEIIEAHKLRKWLLKQPSVLTQEQFETLSQELEKPSTWKVSNDDVVMTTENIEKFKVLEKEIRSAQRVSNIWKIFGV